jgi:nitrogen fixation protein NifX
MLEQPISNEVALRIALASRIFPDLTIGEFIGILQDLLNDTLTEETLKTVTVTNLKTALGQTYQLDGDEDGEDANAGDILLFKEAVRILWGETSELDQLPAIEEFQGDGEHCVRVAVASNNREKLDGHFGSCLRFLIYRMSEQEIKLVDIRSALEADLSDDKNRFRVDLIKDCHVVIITAIGGPAAAKVVQAGIYPIKEEGGLARERLAALQQAIRTSPPPWLAKILGVSHRDRVKNYKASGYVGV